MMEEKDGKRVPKTLENMPDVVLEKIFTYLDASHLCRARRVCSRWYKVTKYRWLWRNVDAGRLSLSTRQIEKFLQMLPRCVQKLRFRALPEDDYIPYLMMLRFNFPVIESLIMEDVTLIATETSYITLENFPSTLLVLSLRSSVIRPRKLFSKAFPIQTLDLNMCNSFTDDHVELLSKFESLREIYLTGCSITDFGLYELAKAVPAITVLDVENTNVRGFALEPLSRNCLALEKLFLGSTEVTDEQLRLISKGSFPNLWTICLKRTDTAWASHRHLLSLLPALQYLNGFPRNEVMKREMDEGFENCDHFFKRNTLKRPVL